MGAHGDSRSGGRVRLLVAGGGVAAIEAMLAIRELAGELVEVELLAPKAEFVYRPLAVVEPFGGRPAMSYDLVRIAEDVGATFRPGALHEVDARHRLARTARGDELGWDVLLVAVGARTGIGIEGAVAVKGPGYTGRFTGVLRELEDRRVRRLTFAVPPGASWPLPLYELALMTADLVEQRGLRDVELRLVTPEAAPLELFGGRASAALAMMLDERGIEVYSGHHAAAVGADGLELVPHGDPPVPADRVVSLPTLRGPRVSGLPADGDGFIPVDLHARVRDLEDVYAAGDATNFPIKQGGIATQQADTAAEAIAALAGADIDPAPFRPVLRGMLLTGKEPRFMRAEVTGGRGEDWEVSRSALWWPPAKIAGRYLAPYLALRHGQLEQPGGGVRVDVPLTEPVRRAMIAKGPGGHRAIPLDGGR